MYPPCSHNSVTYATASHLLHLPTGDNIFTTDTISQLKLPVSFLKHFKRHYVYSYT